MTKPAQRPRLDPRGDDAAAGHGAPRLRTEATLDAVARLHDLAARWQRRRHAAAALAAVGMALPLAAAVWRLGPAAARLPLAVAALALPLVVAVLLARRHARDAGAIAAHLDRRLPALFDSAGLLLAPPPLPALQRLQQRRAAVVLLAEDEATLAGLLPQRPLRRATALLVFGVLLAVVVAVVPLPRGRAPGRRAMAPATPPTAAPRTALLRSLGATVRPPAYTGRTPRQSSGLGVTAEEGAVIRWRLAAAPAVTSATLLLDELERLPLRRLPDGGFEATQVARSPRLLRLLLAGGGDELWRSSPARLEVLPDRPPVVELLAPAATLVQRPVGPAVPLTLELALADDHGVAGAELVVTLAAGSGEGVKFQERRLPLPVRSVASRQVVRRTLDLTALGFAADSELYLRVEARDRRPPVPNVTRSPTVVVRPPGERLESVALGEGLPMIAPPEVFRSQRQIVLDTQRLLAEAPRLAAGEVMRRSREIAFDQRALRLRYGTLLGQEFEEGRPAGPEDGGPGGESPGGVPDGVPEGLAHEHDSEESATFLPDPVRRKLRAMLGAMWDAEGALAIGTPRAALPHELRALELLKEVQQADRVYVRKAASEGAPLDPARRLTGDLDDVHDLATRQAPPQPQPVVAAALGALAALDGLDAEALGSREPSPGSPSRAGAGDLATLRPVLAVRARDGSAPALAALPALDALAAGERLTPALRDALERALWELVPPPQGPLRREAPAGRLWERYRQRLGGAP